MTDSNTDQLQLPPHSIEAEEGLIACCLMEADKLSEAVESQVKPDWFFKEAHRVIFDELLKIHTDGQEPCEVALYERLRKSGREEESGGLAQIYHIQGRIETAAHFKVFLQTVREKFELRRIIREARVAIEDATDGHIDPVQISARLSRLADLSGDDSRNTVIPAIDSAKQAIERMTRQMKGEEEKGVCFGLKDLDDMMFGLQKAEMTILAARPGTGKTSLIQTLNEQCERDNVGMLVFSLEMMAWQYDYRYLCMKARVDSRRLREGVASDNDQRNLAEAYKQTQNSKRWIVDAELDVHQIRATARRVCQKHSLGVIVVDYLQLVRRDPKMKGEQAIADISRGLKQMSKELELPVMALAQLNRECEKEGRRPILSDLRESGSIEQDADNVIFLNPTGSDPMAALLEVEAIIRKNRYGPLGPVSLMFNKAFTRYELAERRAVAEADEAPKKANSYQHSKADQRAFERMQAQMGETDL